MAKSANYFLPLPLERALRGSHAKGIEAKKAVLDWDGFMIPGFILHGNARALRRFITWAPIYRDLHSLLEAFKSRGKKKRARGTLAVRAEGQIEKVAYKILGGEPSIRIDAEEGMRLLYGGAWHNDVYDTLTNLSAACGASFTLASPDSSYSPQWSAGTHLHLVIDAAPPGDSKRNTGEKICGVLVAPGQKVKYAMHGPAKGYTSIVAKDGDGRAVGQIVGDTLYHFMPIAPEFETAFVEAGSGLFKKMLRLIWNAMREKPQLQDFSPISDARSYVGALDAHSGSLMTLLKEGVAGFKHEIADYEEKIRQLTSDWRATQLAYDQAAHLHGRRDRTQQAREWRRAQKHQDIRSWAIVEESVQVETCSIVSAPYESKRYRYGRLIIRLGPRGDVYIWSTNPRGPHGLVHPHIGASGNPCLGNIGPAIREAILESRLLDAINLILRWVREGYDPTLAENKIEQWPTFRRRKK